MWLPAGALFLHLATPVDTALFSIFLSFPSSPFRFVVYSIWIFFYLCHCVASEETTTTVKSASHCTEFRVLRNSVISIMRIARLFDIPKVLHSTPPPPPPPPPISSGCDDHRHIEEIITTAAAAAAAAASNQSVEKSLPTQQQQQQYIWTQGFEKLLEDPLGLRAFAVSLFLLHIPPLLLLLLPDNLKPSFFFFCCCCWPSPC